jgi:DNA replication protein DnaD
MSEDGQNLIVTQEHVEWARNFMVACYDNKLFKLREYVDMQRRLVECDDTTVDALQGMYNSHAIMFKQLEMSTDMSQRDLQMVSGLEPKEFSKTLNQLVKYDFVAMTGSKITPTQRFRTAMSQIDRQVFMKKVGEN